MYIDTESIERELEQADRTRREPRTWHPADHLISQLRLSDCAARADAWDREHPASAENTANAVPVVSVDATGKVVHYDSVPEAASVLCCKRAHIDRVLNIGGRRALKRFWYTLTLYTEMQAKHVDCRTRRMSEVGAMTGFKSGMRKNGRICEESDVYMPRVYHVRGLRR